MLNLINCHKYAENGNAKHGCVLDEVIAQATSNLSVD
jgi:hypothetical protein